MFDKSLEFIATSRTICDWGLLKVPISINTFDQLCAWWSNPEGSYRYKYIRSIMCLMPYLYVMGSPNVTVNHVSFLEPHNKLTFKFQLSKKNNSSSNTTLLNYLQASNHTIFRDWIQANAINHYQSFTNLLRRIFLAACLVCTFAHSW